jgi:hypothetical protein
MGRIDQLHEIIYEMHFYYSKEQKRCSSKRIPEPDTGGAFPNIIVFNVFSKNFIISRLKIWHKIYASSGYPVIKPKNYHS